jgi:hypothetical protein
MNNMMDDDIFNESNEFDAEAFFCVKEDNL